MGVSWGALNYNNYYNIRLLRYGSPQPIEKCPGNAAMRGVVEKIFRLWRNQSRLLVYLY